MLIASVNWPSTGSTSSMMIALSSVIDVPAYRSVISEGVIVLATLTVLTTSFLCKINSRKLSVRLTFIGFATLLSWATLLTSYEIVSNWCASTFTFSRMADQCLSTLAVTLAGFHLLDYTHMNITIDHYGKSTTHHTKFI